MGSDTRIDWPIDRQSKCDSELNLGHGSQGDLKPEMTVLARVSSNLAVSAETTGQQI
jgi:hypothetical protein